jgi:hypothetical protein
MKTKDFTMTEFVGHWRVRRLIFCFDWIFHGDTTFTGKMYLLGIPLLHTTGTWSIEGDKLISNYDESNLVAGGVNDMDTLLEVAQDYFILVTRLGARRKWERVHENPPA